MNDTEKVFRETYPELKIGKNNKLMLKVLKTLLHEDDINKVIEKNLHSRGFVFLDKFFKYFKYSYSVSPDSYNNISSEGRLVIAANHTIGNVGWVGIS